MATLRPYFYSENAREQASFYAKALDGKITDIRTYAGTPYHSEENPDKVMHLVLHAAGLTIYMADSDRVERGNGLDLTLEFKTEEEARRAFDRLSEGGSVLMPFEQMFWGTMFGRIVDPFGVRWQITTEA